MANNRNPDKVAIVTGGGAGIGRASALALAADGFAVVAADVDVAGAEETAHLIESTGGRALAQRTDVTSDADCAALVALALERFGRLDAAFNNAGVAGDPLLTHDYGMEQWLRVIDVNLNGVFRCLRHEIPALRQSGGGAIVNTSSVAGLRGAPGGSAYNASKHGVLGLTKCAALECGRYGIRVNAVCPGFIETQMTTGQDSVFSSETLQAGVKHAALRRLGEPAEVASMVAWLCSESASYVTGASFVVDAGLSAGY